MHTTTVNGKLMQNETDLKKNKKKNMGPLLAPDCLHLVMLDVPKIVCSIRVAIGSSRDFLHRHHPVQTDTKRDSDSMEYDTEKLKTRTKGTEDGAR